MDINGISMDINGISMEYQWIMDINGYHDFTQHLSTSITSTGYEQHAGRRPEAGNRGQLFRNSCGAVQEVISPHIPSYEGFTWYYPVPWLYNVIVIVIDIVIVIVIYIYLHIWV